MGDIICRRCGEPWDSYEVYHEFTHMEKRRFLEGLCCPCCKDKDVEDEPHDEEFISTALEETDDPDTVLDYMQGVLF